MNNRTRLISIFFIFALIQAYGQVNLADLQVEYQKKPLGIDVEKPRFSWKMQAQGDESGISQKAYRIAVHDEKGKMLWNTGKQSSGKSLNILYRGLALAPTTRYSWKLEVWTNKDEHLTSSAWFETGLMNPSPELEAWDGAQWIGGWNNDLPLYAQALSVFKGSFKLRLDQKSGSKKAGFVFGANDQRLMKPYLNILGVNNKTDASYFVFQLDLEGLSKGKKAHFNILRRGYAPDEDKEKMIYSFPIAKELINEQNKYDRHAIYFEMNFGKCLIYINGREHQNLINSKDEPTWVDVRGVSLNPLGDAGGDLIVYPVLADIGFKMPPQQKAFFSDLKITNYRAPSNALFNENLNKGQYDGIFNLSSAHLSLRNNSYMVQARDSASLITADPTKNGIPMLRTEFNTDKKIQKARLYATARGVYEFYINGEKVGNNYFAPGLTQYNKIQMYQTYDITGFLKKGQNAIGALLGEGWWSGNISYRGYNWNYFGDRQSLLAKIVVTFTDGSTKTIATTPEKWQFFNDGVIRYASFFQGEYHDNRKKNSINGWSRPGYNAQMWKQAKNVPLNKHTAHIDAELNYDEQKIIGQIGSSPEIVKTITPKSVTEVRPGVFVYDMGQNMVGFPKIQLNTNKPDTIRLRYAEMLYPDLPQYNGKAGTLMLENIRGALTTDQWILADNAQPVTITPKFTFHGFRFMEITGIEKAIPLENITGMVVSSIDSLASHFETSNPEVNKLWENITWSFRSNFLSIPTDTPARNERMGWNGDINVFAKTATYLGDVDLFLKRHLIANRNLQSPEGRFPDIAPIGTGFGGTLWGSAGITIAWELYRQYGDKQTLKNHYPAMKRYVEFLASKENENGILNEGPLGDWLSPEGFKNDNTLLWTAYQIENLFILYKTAKIIGEEEEAKDFEKAYRKRKSFFNRTYIDREAHTRHTGFDAGSIAPKPEDFTKAKKDDLVDTQASYAIPLNFGIIDRDKQAAKNLAASIERKNRDYTGKLRPEKSLMTGFIGTSALLPALSDYGYNGLAYDLLQQTSYPSWLYSVENGATTIWERLNSYTKEEGFGGNNSMNSFNHYSFGAVGGWMYAYSLGIKPLTPGYKEIHLCPTPDPDGKMNRASGYYDSVYGKIKSAWETAEGQVTYTFTIPPNTQAQVEILCDADQQLSFKNYRDEVIEKLGSKNGRRVFKVLSGTYQIRVRDK